MKPPRPIKLPPRLPSELPKGWQPPPALVADLKKVVESLKARDNTNNGRRIDERSTNRVR